MEAQEKDEEIVVCDDCEDTIPKSESIATIKDNILCYGCDSKRLAREQ